MTAASQVSWQTACWSIIPVALALMTQRAGSVCGTPPCLQVYLRTSPFVCLFDTLVLVARMFADIVFGKSTLGEAARRVVRARTGGPVQVDNMRVVNWIAYALGVLPAYIKLFGFTKIPWTRAWASTYVASYIAIEVLFVLGAELEKQVVKENNGAASTPALIDPKDESSKVWDRVARYSCVVALLLHLALLIWTSHSIFGYDLSLFWEYGHLLRQLAVTQFLIVFTVMMPSDFPSSDGWYHWLGLEDGGVALFMPFFLAAFLLAMALGVPICWFLMPQGLLFEALAVLFFVSLLLAKVRTLSDQVFLAQDGYKVEACAVWTLSMVTTGVMFWWYALRYQPEGTSKAEWTDIFG
jgi:hypothetical protein